MSDPVTPPSTNWTPDTKNSSNWTPQSINATNWNPNDSFESSGGILLSNNSELLASDNVTEMGLM